MKKHLMFVLTAATLAMSFSPANAWAQSHVPSDGEAVAAITGAFVGTTVGTTVGVIGGVGLASSQCTGFDLVCGLGYLVLGTAAIGVTTGTASGLLVSSAFDPGHSAGYMLLGAGLGAAAGVGVLIASDPTNPDIFAPTGAIAAPIFGASVGALLGYVVPVGTSVSLTPLEGGGSARVGFTF